MSSDPTPQLRRARPFYNSQLLARDPIGFFTRLQRRYGDFVHYRGLLRFFFVNRPESVGFVLKHTNDLYDKQSVLYRRFANVTGEGLLSSGGSHWAKQRRLLQPEYVPRRLEQLVPSITGPTKEMLERWQPWIADGRQFDVAAEMHNLTLQVAGRAFLGFDFDVANRDIHRWMAVFSEYVAKPPLPLLSDMRFPSWSNIRLRSAHASFSRFIRRSVIASRRDSQPESHVLSRLLSAADTMSESQLIDEIMTLIIAGHETASNALAWSWYFLATHSTERDRLFEEVDRVLDGRIPTAEDIPQLKFTRMVAEESMRLAPPVWLITRSAMKTHQLGHAEIPKRAMVVICPYTLHRHPDLWSEPNRFNPDRFSDESGTSRHRHSFIPFGAGPHVCIGARFAMMELVLILAMIATRARLRLTEDRAPRKLASFTLSPRNGLQVSAIERRARTRTARAV